MKTPQACYEPRSTVQPAGQRTVRRVRYVRVLGALLGVACVIAVASSAYATSTIVYVVCTCDARNAGTDDLVEMTHAGGGTTPWQPLDNGGIDDNERGLCYRFAYHNQPDVDPIEVKLRIRGKDGWCFNWVEAWRLPEHSPVIGLRWFSGDWRDGIWLDNNETMRDWLHLPTECNRWGNCFGFVGEPEF